ncbi:DUF2845 domain-containing protein [Pseudomonas syringae]|uniref:DUF2845 domain-containing protein n=1 Tax=Pseudomonas syringae TaxID=317 RepID=UPI0032BF5C84
MKRVRYSIISGVVLSLALMSFQNHAFADMRCGTSLVSEGDSTHDVKRKCGEPSTREIIPATPSYQKSQRNHAATVENWVYGPQNGAYYHLKFLDGKLASITFSR